MSKMKKSSPVSSDSDIPLLNESGSSPEQEILSAIERNRDSFGTPNFLEKSNIARRVRWLARRRLKH